VIRNKTTIDLEPLEDVADFLDNFDEVVRDVGQRVVDEWAPELLTELRVTPGKPKYPIEWTSERQRKKVMADLRAKDNLPYQRSDELPNAWEVVNTSTDGAFSILVINRSSKAKFVYGSLARNVEAARRFQQKFHINTGWQFARNTVFVWLDVMETAFRREIIDVSQSSTRRRAYTR
jgi:hypothetical protein